MFSLWIIPTSRRLLASMTSSSSSSTPRGMVFLHYHFLSSLVKFPFPIFSMAAVWFDFVVSVRISIFFFMSSF